MTTDTHPVKLKPNVIEMMDTLGIKLSDPADLAVRIASRLALANSPEELFAEAGSNGWDEHVGVPFLIRHIDWLPSEMRDGIGFYAVVEAVNTDTGEPTVLTTGSTGVTIQLARASQMGWLDKPVKLALNERPTSGGFYPHRLKLA